MKINLDYNNASSELIKNTALDALVAIKSVVISTVDKNNAPSSRIVDIMFRDGDRLYFLTEKVKPFYFELMANNKISITIMNKDYVQVRLKGECEKVSQDKINTIYEKNPSFKDLFSPQENNMPFQIFSISKGKGEIFDLSGGQVKMQRARFSFGGESVNPSGCIITDSCINCGKCLKYCPFNAISKNIHYEINPIYCDECGICKSVCPVDAIVLPKGL